MYELALLSDIQHRLRAEILQVLKNTTVNWHMMASKICRTWTGLCQVRNEESLNNNVRLIALGLIMCIQKLLAASLCRYDVWVKKVPRILNSQFPRKERNPYINRLNAELNPICYLLALLGAHHILHVSGLRVKYPGTIETIYFVATACVRRPQNVIIARCDKGCL